MPVVWIPSLLRQLTHGQEKVSVTGTNIGQVIAELERLFPGMQARLCDGDHLRAGMAVIVGTEVARLGLSQSVGEKSEVHFLPAVSGGSFRSEAS
jgi:molybdopterin converting factor small subunit